MGICDNNNNDNPEPNNEISFIRCTYLINDKNETPIINYRGKVTLNQEIKSKIKINILNDNKEKQLPLKKKFNIMGLNYIDFIITGKFNDMSFMFKDCSSLKEIQFNNIDTGQVTKMNNMFEECEELEKLDISNFNTSNVTEMECMFNKCSKLKEIKGINNFNTSKVTDMRGMFQGCFELINLDLSSFDTSNVTDITHMFYGCHKLKKINGINNFYTPKVNDMRIMFQNCNELECLDLSNFNTSNVTDMEFMFNECHKLKEIKGINKFNTSKVINMSQMFQNCKELKYLDVSNFNTSNVTDMEGMFWGCKKLEEIKGINNFNTAKVNNMKSMFEKCKKVEILDLSKFNTSNVTDMRFMFAQCLKLKEIKGINNFNTSKVTSINEIFKACNELESLDLSNFDTSNITDMEGMFFGCHKLKEIKGINNFKTSKVTNMKSMFQECKELEYLDLSNFNTANVTDMEWMFWGCKKLNIIKGINNFDLSNIKNFYNGNNKELLSKLDELKNKKPIAVNFISLTPSIQYPIACYDTDKFSKLENELYKEYPELKNKNIYFLANGITINRTSTIKENNIKGGSQIIIQEFEENDKNKEKIFDGCSKELKSELNNPKPIAVIFISVDKKIQCPIACYESDMFLTLKEKLYQRHPELKAKKNIYLVYGNKINETATLKENKINDCTQILIDYIIEENN